MTSAPMLGEVFRAVRSALDAYSSRQLGLAFLLIVMSAASVAAAPAVLKVVLDSLGSGDAGAAAGHSLLLVALYVGIQFLGKTAAEVRLLAFGQGEQRLRRNLSRRLAAHVLDLPLRFHVGRRTGAVGETISLGLRGSQMLVQHALFTLVPVVVEVVLVAVVLLRFGHDIYLAILLGSAVAYVLAFARGAARVVHPTRAASAGQIDAQSALTDSLLNYETIKYFAAERMASDRYDRLLAETESAWRAFYRRRASNGLAVASIFALSLGFSLTLAASGVVQGTMTVGDFVLVNAYLVRIAQPLEMAGYAVRDVSQGVALLERMLAFLKESPEERRGPAAATLREIDGELAFEGVSFSYGARKVLDGVSFRVPRGKTVAIVGASGSGKSSLVRLLFRLYEPDSGRILLDGQPIRSMSLDSLRRSIAVVAQDTALLDDTIASNVAIGRPEASRADIERAVRLARLDGLIEQLPERYETRVGERGVRLSGGERQRVAIARAVLKGSRMFVFDEATSSLDSHTEQEILINVREMARASTTLVIAHRLSTVVNADEILVLDRGRIRERGTHAALLALGGLYAALWQAQSAGHWRAPLPDSGHTSSCI